MNTWKSQKSSLPSGEARGIYRGKIERLAEETRALVDDLADWVELKITLTRLEIEEQLNEHWEVYWGMPPGDF